MLSIDQLAHARSLSVKISYLLDEIAALPAQASECGGEQGCSTGQVDRMYSRSKLQYLKQQETVSQLLT